MVKILEIVTLAIFHPHEFKAVLNYYIWKDDPTKRLEDNPESSRINVPSMAKCWKFLDKTSRSFSAVVKEVEGDLARVICIFYLVLRGLDTIEDDMTIDIDLKEELLKTFYLKLDQPGWNFDKSGPNEKDRQLLVEFENVIEEFHVLEPDYRTIISDVTARMGGGMARFSRLAADQNGIFSVETMSDFDDYCHYVAGVVGEGLSRIFSCSGKEDPNLGTQLNLSNSMGLFLQKTNILRDFREDIDQGRIFWPKEIWGKFVDHPSQLTESSNRLKAKWALSEMVLDTLCHSIDCLEYLTLIKNQSLFNFCAIPQVMAIATVEKCFNNLDVFQKNVKIRRSLMVDLSSRAINPRDLSYIFVDFAQKIHSRIDLSDPSYLKLCDIVSKIVVWAENRYPSYISPTSVPPLYSDDPAAPWIKDVRIQQQPSLAKKLDPLKNSDDKKGGSIGNVDSMAKVARPNGTRPKLTAEELKFTFIIISLVILIIFTVGLIVGGILYFFTKDGETKITLNVPLTSMKVEL